MVFLVNVKSNARMFASGFIMLMGTLLLKIYFHCIFYSHSSPSHFCRYGSFSKHMLNEDEFVAGGVNWAFRTF